MKRTWQLRDDATGHLPPHDEASLVALVAHAANVLAPPFDLALTRHWLRQYEEEETSIETYTLTNEALHGDRPVAVRWVEVQDCSRDAAGPSNHATHVVVTAEGVPASTRLELTIDVRSPPFLDAGLRVEATIEGEDASRVAAAMAVFDQCFGAEHAH
jgi:hypothetical protein